MVLHFQPRVDAFTNEIISAEALIRWNHPEWGIISPIEFLTIAEENGFIEDVDNWVLNEVCHQMKLLKERQILTVPISINISAVHFSVYNWQEKVASIIEDYGIDSKDLEFEITESLLLNNDDSVQHTLNALKSLGIKIVLDDFGTGYSSLSYLTHFPFDIIKIDKSFTQNMVINEKDLFIVKSIIFMAKGLNIKVVAEGVETLEQLKLLKEEQCDEIQG
ncbi:EAL-domain-containing protein, partial [Rhizophagus irregularis]